MALEIKLTIEIKSDFHVGTGTGRGRATDSVVLLDEHGVPFIPGSAIKGLCRWHACRLIDAYPDFGPKPTDKSVKAEKGTGPAFEIFGGGTDLIHGEQRVTFNHAYAKSGPKISLRRNGRSGRDRASGRADTGKLFFYEDAGSGFFSTTLSCEQYLSPHAILLLLLSLRRIEALGGQRRRGKGRCECSVKVVDCDAVELVHLQLPANDDAGRKTFTDFANPLLITPFTPTTPAASQQTSNETDAPNSVHLELSTSAESATSDKSQQKCWLVYAIADSPLTLGHEQAVDNSVATEDYISGTSVRGALAWQAIHRGLLTSSHEFQEAFVKEKIRFGPLYPADTTWMEAAMTLPIPIPASFATCKRHPGTIGDKPQSESHGIVDQFHLDRGDDVCQLCKLPLKPANGYVQLSGDHRSATPKLYQPDQRVFQRTAIDEETERASESQLFGLESVERGTRFAGYIWGDAGLVEKLFGNRLKAWTVIRVGKAKSRGQGNVAIQLIPADGPSNLNYPSMLPNTGTNAPTEKVGTSNSESATPSEPKDFFITLYSDVIAVDSLLRPITSFTAQSFWMLIGGTGTLPFALESGYSNTKRIGGFLGVPGVPRTPDLAIAAGSTWRFRWNADTAPPAQMTALQLLQAAEANGIGLRRGEGFGRIIVDLPLHSAKWIKQTDISACIAHARTRFPNREKGTSPSADRTSYFEHTNKPESLSDDKSFLPFQRLFAELMQSDDPFDVIQQMFDDPLMRRNKSSRLKSVLITLTSKERFGFQLFDEEICIASSVSTAANITRLKIALRKYCGDVSHV